MPFSNIAIYLMEIWWWKDIINHSNIREQCFNTWPLTVLYRLIFPASALTLPVCAGDSQVAPSATTFLFCLWLNVCNVSCEKHKNNYSCCAGMGRVQAVFGKFRQFWATNRRIGRQDSWQQCLFWTTSGLNSQLLEPKTVIYRVELIGKWQCKSGFTNWVSHLLLCRQIWNHCKRFSYQDKNLKIHILRLAWRCW